MVFVVVCIVYYTLYCVTMCTISFSERSYCIIPRPPGKGDFYFKSPGEPRGGEFKNSEYPGAPGVGDFLRPRGMGSLGPYMISLVEYLISRGYSLMPGSIRVC